MLQNKTFSKMLGILIIFSTVLLFTKSLKSNIRESNARAASATTSGMRISADAESNKLYLWGAKDGLTIRSSANIKSQRIEAFYVIEIEDINMAYIIEVYGPDGAVAAFRHFTDEKYPIYPQ